MKRTVDVLVAEIGSTTTIVNAFNLEGTPIFLGQGMAPTTVLEGDVNVGLKAAIEDLKGKIGDFEYKEMLACSSAAGGLKMTVHGLVYDMTVRAAKEAALGAGANIKLITAGKLRRTDLEKIKEIKPNIILLAGGVDYGDRETALYNGEKLAELKLNVPVIYAGNIENREEIAYIFKEAGQEVYIVDNVYPSIDKLNVEPTRKMIQQVFEKHIITAPGMSRVKELVTGNIIPTPGAVMEACILLYNEIGDLMALDIGGATTDVHSVTEGSEEIQKMTVNPEPLAKRTVEGDLGVFVNSRNLFELWGEEIYKKFANAEELIKNIKPVPTTDEEREFVLFLAAKAVEIAVKRHAGKMVSYFGPTGKTFYVEGRDLTAVKWIIGTGGVFTRLEGSEELLKNINDKAPGKELYPPSSAKVLIDRDYIMAACGVLSKKYPEEALRLLKNSLGI